MLLHKSLKLCCKPPEKCWNFYSWLLTVANSLLLETRGALNRGGMSLHCIYIFCFIPTDIFNRICWIIFIPINTRCLKLLRVFTLRRVHALNWVKRWGQLLLSCILHFIYIYIYFAGIAEGEQDVSQLNAVHQPLTPEHNWGYVRGVLARCPATSVCKLQKAVE